MRVLVDTSVWIDHFRKGDKGLAALLQDNEVLCHPFVVGELACGRLDRREEILESLNGLPIAPVVEQNEALHFLEIHDLHEKGIGFVDLHLLASTYLGKVKLWTRDKRLNKLAMSLGIAFQGN
jgi:predicted nucleic acid-binding protein